MPKISFLGALEEGFFCGGDCCDCDYYCDCDCYGLAQFKKNTICCLVLKSFFRLMLTLCLYDMVYLVASLMIFSLPLLWPSLVMSVNFTYSIPYLLPIAHIAMTGNILEGWNFVFAP